MVRTANDLRQIPESELYSRLLYVRRGDRASEQAAAMAEALPDVCVEDIDGLERPLPRWLVGVPTLVDKNGPDGATAYRGTACLHFLEGCEPPTVVDRNPKRIRAMRHADRPMVSEPPDLANGQSLPPPVKLERAQGISIEDIQMYRS